MGLIEAISPHLGSLKHTKWHDPFGARQGCKAHEENSSRHPPNGQGRGQPWGPLGTQVYLARSHSLTDNTYYRVHGWTIHTQWACRGLTFVHRSVGRITWGIILVCLCGMRCLYTHSRGMPTRACATRHVRACLRRNKCLSFPLSRNTRCPCACSPSLGCPVERKPIRALCMLGTSFYTEGVPK